MEIIKKQTSALQTIIAKVRKAGSGHGITRLTYIALRNTYMPKRIRPAEEAMSSRERMLAAINLQPVDRAPLDLSVTDEVMKMLLDHFGSNADINSALHIDGFARADARYVGPAFPKNGNCWGMRFKRMDYGSGVYQEQSFFPLAGARSVDDLEAYSWPQADWFDCSDLVDRIRPLHEHRAVMVGKMAPFYLHNQLRGLEQSLMDPWDDPEFTHHLLSRITDHFVALHRRIFEAAEGLIDVTQVTDDFGSQIGPMISLDAFREFYKPYLGRCTHLAKEFGIKIFHHDDGAIRTFLPDLIELGIDILNPVQWACQDMELDALKRDFGDALCFHGGIENQHILPFGTPEEVRAEVRHCIDGLSSDGTGYILCSCHNIQPGTPLENVLAMYDEAWIYGRCER